jgi:capsular polysaccharide biosynthesis protein
MNNYFNNNSIIDLIYKWKIHIIIITIIGGISGYAISLFLKPEYNSFAIVYPVNIASYSDESNTEQMLQVLQSRDIKDKVISSFDLIEHYNIPKDKKDYLSIIYSIYNKKIDIKKTEYESINITCSDNDPFIAASIVDSIISFYNKKEQDLYRIKIKEVMDLAKSELNKWESIKDSTNAILNSYKEKYGIQNYGVQLQETTNGVYRTNNNNIAKEGKKFIEILGKYLFQVAVLIFPNSNKEIGLLFHPKHLSNCLLILKFLFLLPINQQKIP